MNSNLDPFRLLFGGPGLRCGADETQKLNFDVLVLFSKSNACISVDVVCLLKSILKSCSAEIWPGRFQPSICVLPFLGCCTPSRFLGFTPATQDRYAAPAAVLFPELRCGALPVGPEQAQVMCRNFTLTFPSKQNQILLGLLRVGVARMNINDTASVVLPLRFIPIYSYLFIFTHITEAGPGP